MSAQEEKSTLVIDYLNKNNIEYTLWTHAVAGPSSSSAEARKAVGAPDSTGAKALVIKSKKLGFVLLIVSGHKRLDSKKAKTLVGRFSFATKEELFELTGLVPGEIPPFAKPILDIDTMYVDVSLKQEDLLAFNVCKLDVSILLKAKDYFELVSPDTADLITDE